MKEKCAVTQRATLQYSYTYTCNRLSCFTTATWAERLFYFERCWLLLDCFTLAGTGWFQELCVVWSVLAWVTEREREKERERESKKYSTQMPINQHWGCVLWAAELLLMLIYWKSLKPCCWGKSRGPQVQVVVPEARLLIGSPDYLTTCSEINEILISESAFRDDKTHHNQGKHYYFTTFHFAFTWWICFINSTFKKC